MVAVIPIESCQEGLELGFRVGIVVTDMRPRVRLGDSQKRRWEDRSSKPSAMASRAWPPTLVEHRKLYLTENAGTSYLVRILRRWPNVWSNCFETTRHARGFEQMPGITSTPTLLSGPAPTPRQPCSKTSLLNVAWATKRVPATPLAVFRGPVTLPSRTLLNSLWA